MCGRYVLFTDEEEDDITDLVHQIQERLRNQTDDDAVELRINGEIFPSQRAPVLAMDGPFAMKWGLPGYQGKGLIINARAESVYGKTLFRPAITSRRIAVLSHGFYEWRKPGRSAQKDKLLFNLPDARQLYLAGLYNEYEDAARFAIITTEANESMKQIHHRMPVILMPNEVEQYLSNDGAACKLISRIPPSLDHRLAS